MSALGPWRFHVLGYPVGLGQPLFLLLVLVALGLGVVAVLAALRRRARVQALIRGELADRLAPGVSVARPSTSAALAGLGLALMALGLSQPQCGGRSKLVKRQGIDVVVVLDASRSMLARDVQPSRLERAKLELTHLLESLKGDRVGIVVFAGEAFVQCPLTSDYEAAKLFLRAVNPDDLLQGGSNIGEALEVAKDVFESADRGAKERVVVLLSDGEDFGGEVGAATARLNDAGVRVYAIGIGGERGEPIPVFNKRGEQTGFKKDSAGNTVMTRLNRAGLQLIADGTGGELFVQRSGVAVGEVVRIVDQLQKDELESRRVVQYDEAYQPFVGLGLIAWLGALAIRPSKRRPR